MRNAKRRSSGALARLRWYALGLALSCLPVTVPAAERGPAGPEHSGRGGAAAEAEGFRRLLGVPEIARWLNGEDAGGAARTLTSMAVVRCNCTDKPAPHFPYVMVVVSAGEEDLVARLEAHENALRASPIAVRRGERYCAPDDDEPCFGDFAHPCEFSDARFGPSLAEFFPGCKTPD